MTAEPEVTTVYEPEDDPADISLVGEINRVLHQHYPGWTWGVEIPPGQRVVIIRNLTCDPHGKMGMVQYKDRLDPTLRCVVRAAGEFLERYNMRRGRFDPAFTEGRIMHAVRADDDPRGAKRTE